jgi:hypothetical protein
MSFYRYGRKIVTISLEIDTSSYNADERYNTSGIEVYGKSGNPPAVKSGIR